MRAIAGLPADAKRGVYVREPDTFGVSGKVLAKIDASDSTNGQLQEALAKFEPPVKNHRQTDRLGYTADKNFICGGINGGLAAPSAHEKTEIVSNLGFCSLKKHTRQDSNLQPSVPKTDALSS